MVYRDGTLILSVYVIYPDYRGHGVKGQTEVKFSKMPNLVKFLLSPKLIVIDIKSQ